MTNELEQKLKNCWKDCGKSEGIFTNFVNNILDYDSWETLEGSPEAKASVLIDKWTNPLTADKYSDMDLILNFGEEFKVGDKVFVDADYLRKYDLKVYTSQEVEIIEPTENTPLDYFNVSIPHNHPEGGLNVPKDKLVKVEGITFPKTTLINPLSIEEIDPFTTIDYVEPKHKGLRFNEGKLRYDLVHPYAHEQMVRVLTMGSQKYAERNWENGMAWSNVISSLKRHLAAIEKGEDYDSETGELHAAHLACNAHFLTAYYKIYPQGDDRPHTYLNQPKIGLDIDEVIADWVGAWTEKHGMVTPEFWNFDTNIQEKFEQIKDDKDFWMSIKPRINPKDLPFEPHCYITSRPIPTEWTQEWIEKNGFPTMPVYTVGYGESKVEVAKASGIDIFVDDRYDNFVELNKAGICTFLMDAKHNERYQVGYRRIHDLKELI